MKAVSDILHDTTFKLFVFPILICIFAFSIIAPTLEKFIYIQATPPIQNDYDIVLNIYEADSGQFVETVREPDALLYPFSKAISILLTTLLVSVFEYLFVRYKIKLGSRYKHIDRPLTIVKTVLIFCGLIATIYSLYDLDASAHFYRREDEPFISKILYSIVANGRKISEIMTIISASAGALLLPFDYCRREEIQQIFQDKINYSISLQTRNIQQHVTTTCKRMQKEASNVARQESRQIARQVSEQITINTLNSYEAKIKKQKSKDIAKSH